MNPLRAAAEVVYIAPPPHVLRRQLLAELEGIREVIEQSGKHDAMTRLLGQWREDFLATLRPANRENVLDEQVVLERFQGVLKRILREPLYGAFLGQDAVEGNDGECYDPRALALFLSTLPVEFRWRSPVTGASPFVTAPHSVVPHLVGWLERRGVRLENPEIEARFQGLSEDDRLIPTEETERIRRLIERQEARRRQAMPRLEQAAREAQERQAAAHAELEAERRAFAEEREQRFAAYRAALDAEVERLRRDTEVARGEVRELEEHHAALERGAEGLTRDFSELRKQTTEMEKRTTRLEQAAAERAEAKGDSVMGVCVSIALSLIASYLASQAMPPSAGQAGVKPDPAMKQGLSAFFTKKF